MSVDVKGGKKEQFKKCTHKLEITELQKKEENFRNKKKVTQSKNVP